MERADVEFPSGGVSLAAWLYRAGGPEKNGPAPLVVMAHGFSGTRELRLDAYAERFADAGLGALVFDYRHFGASPGEPRQLLDIREQQQDYEAAIAYARGLDWVDNDRIALFGTSFSGGHVLDIAARDSRIAAIIAQCPFTDGLATLRTVGLIDAGKVTAAAVVDQLGALVGRPPRYVPAVGEPGELAVMNTPDSKPGFEALLPSNTRWVNKVAPRIMLHIPTHRPGVKASRIRCPVLACVCDKDSLTPPDRTAGLITKAPRAEIKRYPIGHFDIYVGEWFERAVADQTEFLARQLLTPEPSLRTAPRTS